MIIYVVRHSALGGELTTEFKSREKLLEFLDVLVANYVRFRIEYIDTRPRD